MHYFVNTNETEEKAVITRGSYAIDIVTGERIDFCGEYTFPQYGSLVVIEDGTPKSEKKEEKALTPISLKGEWNVKNATENALTLDFCDYWFDGELQQEDGYILNVASRAYALGRPVDIKCAFKVNMDYVPAELYLACETPEIFKIVINGRELEKRDCGYFRDIAFRKLDVSGYMQTGENVIELYTHFVQSPEVYENMEKSKIFESEKNKLTYDMEIEAMYLVGDFSVRMDGTFVDTPGYAVHFDGKFTVDAPKSAVTLHEIEKQGFPFFAGELTLTKKFNLDSTDYKFDFIRRGVNAVRVKVNGKLVAKVLWAPFSVDLSDYLVVGENEIEITLVNNLRNLLGPHHHPAGELLSVAPPCFYDEGCLWNGFHGGHFTKKYSFVHTSLI